jgi:hypothetical protein
MRTLVFMLLLAVVVGACSLVFDAKGNSSQIEPDAATADGGQHDDDAGPSSDAGHSDDDGGCNPLDDANLDDAGSYPDADVTDASFPVDASEADANW